MSEEQTIMYPTVCLGCKAERVGVQDHHAVYACGTTIKIDPRARTPTAERTQECLQGAPSGQHQSR